MKKINAILNTIMGCFAGVFIGNSIYTFVDYKTHPALYEVNSACEFKFGAFLSL